MMTCPRRDQSADENVFEGGGGGGWIGRGIRGRNHGESVDILEIVGGGVPARRGYRGEYASEGHEPRSSIITAGSWV